MQISCSYKNNILWSFWSHLFMFVLFCVSWCIAFDFGDDYFSVSRNAALIDDDSFINSNFPIAADTNSIANLSQQCLQDIKTQIAALRDGLPWAIEMYESSGSLTDKLVQTVSGNVYHDMGLFDECLSAVNPTRDKDVNGSFQAKYCTVFFHDQQSSNNSTIKGQETSSNEGEPVDYTSNFVYPSVAFCIPSTCSARELRSAVANRVRHLSLVSVTSDDFCYTTEKIKSDRTFDTGAIVTSCVIGLLVLLMAVGTIHECLWGINSQAQLVEDESPIFRQGIIDILHCFSVKRNTLAILSTKVNNSIDYLSCLYGIRFVFMLFVIVGHYSLKCLGNLRNTRRFVKNDFHMDSITFNNGSIFVDSFFLMSGLLVSLALMKQLDRTKGSLQIFRYYIIHRYVRITPLLATALAFMANLSPLIGTGPDWHFMRQMSEATRKMWWSQLLYIHNYVGNANFGWNGPQMGMGEAWYLVCDMQMFVLSPLFIYPLWKWKKVGLIWVIFCLFGFLGASAIPFVTNPDLMPTMIILKFSKEAVAKIAMYCDNYYMQTYCRMPSYLIGILLGWLLKKSKENENSIKLNKVFMACGWTIFTLLGLAAVFGLTPLLDESLISPDGLPEFSPLVRIGYGIFNRSAFALSVAWLIFACTHQYGGLVNHLFSWKALIPLSRLCFAAYLINANILRIYSSSQRTSLYFNEIEMILSILAFVTAVFLLSFLASLIVEMPLVNLEKLMFSLILPIEATAASSSQLKKREHQQDSCIDEESKKLNDPESI